ncbi:MAG: M1 family metallopeptidase [Bryobacterales bacterium]|nr:M1 family metallopeptidase [Bryobacterales bacterium]
MREPIAWLGACCLTVTLLPPLSFAQTTKGSLDKFRQLEELLPTPNEYRTASGAPGHRYWQQKVDYDISVELDDSQQKITGTEKITYRNNSPDTVHYLWLQLDQNIWSQNSMTMSTATAPTDLTRMPFGTISRMKFAPKFDGGYKIKSVRNAGNDSLRYTIQYTMMRVDLPSELPPGGTAVIHIDWEYNINPSKKVPGRTGGEFFEKDGNWIYCIAQWFPRLAAYNDVSGWQHKQYLGAGEFTLEFGDYRVRIKVPDDHVVSSTGVLQNPREVLTETQIARLKQAETAASPVMVVTPDEAKANEKSKPKGTKTWVFHAANVRDFAFASSRKFIWDAQGHMVDGRRVMAMSFYPKEANPLWEKYSTAAVIHTLNVYGRYSFSYPYPTAQSVNGVVSGGMEYPMICFNGPRPQEDGTYSARTKYGLITVIIHEVGHNFFPMIVNSDERQWTWMDEGMNTFLQYLSEQEWEPKYPSKDAEPKDIAAYMSGPTHDAIMTSSDSIQNLFANAYQKTATGLNMLRETILGREQFDFAFREFSRRWKFKRPMPADFFRTMEDATGVDLDWFWRGWFYSTDRTDISIEGVRQYRIDTKNPEVEKPLITKRKQEEPETLSAQRNKPLPKLTDAKPELRDFYNSYDENVVTDRDREEYKKFVATLNEEEKELLASGENFYVIDLKNLGGLVMPVILRIEYTDGSNQELRIPAEIWRRNNSALSKMVMTPKEIKEIVLDPHLETADTDLANNYFPRRPLKRQFELFKERRPPNPMQQQKKSAAPATSQQQ